MKFKAKKGYFTGAMFMFTVIACLYTVTHVILKDQLLWMDLLVCLLLSIVIGLFIWIWFDTSYHIDEHKLYYKSGPFRGSIAVLDIVKIESVDYVFSGFKPALSKGGFIIKYNKWDEIYIAPLSNTDMMNALMKINPDIVIDMKKYR